MADYQLIIVGGGLSGIAAGIRASRFGITSLILEQHRLPGGLNSYYQRRGRLFETGLHAMTNYAPAAVKRAPLNLLFRQLKLPRKSFVTREQFGSEIRYPGISLCFENDIEVLKGEVAKAFPAVRDRFVRLLKLIEGYDPFTDAPWRSTRTFLAEHLGDRMLEDMLLLPVMVYGNAEEEDMDLRQFVIMFRAVFLEGFFRPEHTIREFLDQLVSHFQSLGGEIRYGSRVRAMHTDGDRVREVELRDGTRISADSVISTVGVPETARLTGWNPSDSFTGRMSFVETILLAPRRHFGDQRSKKTILFFNERDSLRYRRPPGPVDPSWGVICLPENFSGIEPGARVQVRVTLSANYAYWRALSPIAYHGAKSVWQARSLNIACRHLDLDAEQIRVADCFTPVTIERYTGKAEGAVYGSAIKIRNGQTPWRNLFLAGTDQGYLGIIGSMLSGVAMVNRHLLQDSYQ